MPKGRAVGSGSQPKRHRFEAWLDEREVLEGLLERRGAGMTEQASENLLGRISELEKLILCTRSQELPAIRVKAGLLRWLMTMERADGLSAMQEIETYLSRLGPHDSDLTG